MIFPLSFLYPAVTDDISQLSSAARSAKVARHTPCSACHCRGLHPPDPWPIVLDDSEDAQEEIELAEQSEAPTDEGFWMVCICGHGWDEHGAGLDVSPSEMTRRTKVAMRIDELLQDIGKLLDFEYTDDDIESLRKQMILPEDNRSSTELSGGAAGPNGHSRKHSLASSSSLSDPAADPSSKRRRISSSSLSEQVESSDEDKPLASQVAPASGSRTQSRPSKNHQTHVISLPNDQRAGKMQTSHGGVANTVNKTNEELKREQATALTIKIEDPKLDEGQVNRLASGVTQDVSTTAEDDQPQEKPVVMEERKGLIKFMVVTNDGNPQSMIILTGLKNLFQKQLPKMPREYIARLVYDRNSYGMAIVRRGLQVVGGITYRPFPHRGFAEIVFFAVASVYQVNGYGGHLMNHFKMHIRNNSPTINHFLTYADNYAIGYFKKQGFTKEITLDRKLWTGYIKDYEGGTMMQCTMVGKVDYLNTKNILMAQREAILTKIRAMSKSHVIHSGLEQFRNAPEGFKVDYRDVPGLRESGWNPEMDAVARMPTKSPHYKAMARLLSELQSHPQAWAFLQPVNKEDVTDYYDVIQYPMDFSTMEMKLEKNQYATFNDFVDDALLVFSNCRTYNPEHSIYAKNATKMEKFLRDWIANERSKNDGLNI